MVPLSLEGLNKAQGAQGGYVLSTSQMEEVRDGTAPKRRSKETGRKKRGKKRRGTVFSVNESRADVSGRISMTEIARLEVNWLN